MTTEFREIGQYAYEAYCMTKGGPFTWWDDLPSDDVERDTWREVARTVMRKGWDENIMRLSPPRHRRH